MVTLRMNGRQIKAVKGQSLLKAARAANIEIPALCHNDALEPYGACRLCIVEVKKGAQTTIESSCTYTVAEGLEVQTDSPRVSQLLYCSHRFSGTAVESILPAQDISQRLAVKLKSIKLRSDLL